MKIKSLNIRGDSVEFCYEGSSIRLSVINDELRIYEEVTYEVAIGEIFSKIQIVIKDGKVFLSSPFGENEVNNPQNIINGIKEILELIKNKNTKLYGKINNIISA